MSTNYVNEVVELEPTEIADLTVSGFVTLLDEDHLQINIWSWVGDEWDIVSAEMKYLRESEDAASLNWSDDEDLMPAMMQYVRDGGEQWRIDGVANLNWFGDEDLDPEMQELWESICDSIDRAVRSGILFTKGA